MLIFNFVFGFDWQNIDEFDVVVEIPYKVEECFVSSDMVSVKLVCLERFSVEIETREFVFCDVVELCIFHFFVLVFVFVVAVVAPIWTYNLTILISCQQLFFKKMKIIFVACGCA